MAAADDIAALIGGLPDAWKTLLKNAIGLDANSTDLVSGLTNPTTVDRGFAGFQDFGVAPAAARASYAPGDRAVLPGYPEFSALYHALASPRVDAGTSSGLTLDDLDRLENLIVSLKPFTRDDIPHDAVIGVFAYEYRPAASTTHRRHADFVYSRTGIARIGEQDPAWDCANRCWKSLSDDGKFRAMPARYGVFLATPRKRSPTTLSAIGDIQDGDDSRSFLLPIRKLFPGDDCIAGQTIRVTFAAFHRREKLRRIFSEGGFANPPGISGPPYVRESTDYCAPRGCAAGELVQLCGLSATLLVQSPAAPLVRPARLPQPDGAGRTFASLTVPRRSILRWNDFATNRDASSLRIITGLGRELLEYVLTRFEDVKIRPRQAPEFVNIRFVEGLPPNEGTLTSLAATLLTGEYEDTVNAGGYQAVLFEDSCCDGCITATVDGLDLPVRPAFSIVTAPDFFPFAEEIDLNDWVETFPSHNAHDQFGRGKGGPDPLCNGRFPPNITLFLPGGRQPAFSADDEGATAIVGVPYADRLGPTYTIPHHRTTTFLTDKASNVFAPGWEVTFAEQDGVKFYSTFGLGAPFLEDAKLCAANSAFWPAVSPDASRTFNKGPTAIPMLDSELGWHADNPRAPASAPPTFGWDGEQGPFIVEATATLPAHVNFASFWRSDYVENYLININRPDVFAGIDSAALIDRMDCLRLCIQCLPPNDDVVSSTTLWLVHAEAASVPTTRNGPPAAPGYRFEFVTARDTDPVPAPGARNRQLLPFDRRFECLVGHTQPPAAPCGVLTWREIGGTRGDFVAVSYRD
jgi:hypothetical protein